MYERILVATDGSEPASRALEYGLDLAATFDADLFAISVVDTHRYGDSVLSGPAAVVDDLERRAEDVLATVRRRVDGDATTELRHGRPHEEIARYAAAVDVDLVVIGNRGLGGGDTIGSTAERIVRYVDRPVLTA